MDGNQHIIARVQQHLKQAVQGELGAGGDDDLTRIVVHVVLRRNARADRFAQRRQAGGRQIITGRPGVDGALAASAIGLGVGKSGWPIDKSMTSSPAAFICLVKLLIANVALGATLTMRLAKCIVPLP